MPRFGPAAGVGGTVLERLVHESPSEEGLSAELLGRGGSW